MANVIQIVISALNKTGQGLTAPIRSLDDLGKAASKLRPAMTALAAGAGAAAVAMANRWLETAEATGKAAMSAGVGVEAFSSLSYAANLADVSSEKLQKGLAKLAVGMHDAATGSGAAADTFRQLGLSTLDASGKMLSTDQMLLQVADRFQKMGDTSERTAAAVQLFGKSGYELIPMLSQGAAGIKSMQQEADALGVTITESGAASAERFNDSLKRLRASTDGFVNMVMGQIAPSMATLAESFVSSEMKSGTLKVAADLLADSLKYVAVEVVKGYTGIAMLAQWAAALADIIEGALLAAFNTAIQLVKRWAVALIELENIIRSSAGSIQQFAAGLAQLSSGNFIAAASSLGTAFATSGDEGKKALESIAGAASDSATMVAKSATDLVGSVKGRLTELFLQNVQSYGDMVKSIQGINNGAMAGGPRKASAGGGDAPANIQDDGYFKSLWEQSAKDEQKARELMAGFRIEAMTGIQQQRAAEVQAFQDRLTEINSLQIAESESLALRAAAEQAHLQKMRALETANNQHLLQGYANAFGNMASIFQAFGRKQFAAAKAFSIGQAIMNTAQAVTKTLAEYSYPINIVFAAITAAAGAAEISTIASQQPPSYAVGSEFIPATGPAVVHQGERIVQSDINADLTEFLSSGSGGGPTHVTILLDGEVLARAMGNMSRDGRLELSARAIA